LEGVARSPTEGTAASVGGEGGGCTQPAGSVLEKDRHPASGRSRGLQPQLAHASGARRKRHPALVPWRMRVSCFAATQVQLLTAFTQHLNVHCHFTPPQQSSLFWTFSKAPSLSQANKISSYFPVSSSALPMSARELAAQLNAF